MTVALPPLAGPTMSPTQMMEMDGIRRFSNSEIQSYKRCKRKWFLSYYEKWQPRTSTHVGAMAVGSRIHKALQYYYQSRVPGADPIDLKDILELLIDYDRDLLLSDTKNNDDTFDIFAKEADLERIMIDGYVEWLAHTGADSQYEIIGAETYQEANIIVHTNTAHERIIRIIARIDLRVRQRTNNAVLLLDHKTTASFSDLISQLPMNEQMLWYILIEYLNSSGNHAHGALYNMIKRSKRSARAKPPFYMRHSVHHNRFELAAFQQRVIGVITDILQTEEKLNNGMNDRIAAYPTPSRDCTWSCPFFMACKMMDDGSHAREMLSRVFIQGDPLGYYVSGITESNVNE